MQTKFWLENLQGRDHLEDQGMGEMIILEWILGKIGWEGVGWIHMAQDRDQWWTVVNMVMNLWVI
jgi:hypothetical protein